MAHLIVHLFRSELSFDLLNIFFQNKTWFNHLIEFLLGFVGEKLSSNLSRFVMFVWLIVVLVLITGYTAMLTSLLTVEQFELAYKSGTVGFQRDSFVGVTINNLNFTNRKNTYHSYEDYADALSKGGKNGGADAIVDEVPYIKMFLSRYSSDEYAMVSSQPVTSGFGFVSIRFL